jgi:hypothetical protein
MFKRTVALSTSSTTADNAAGVVSLSGQPDLVETKKNDFFGGKVI